MELPKAPAQLGVLVYTRPAPPEALSAKWHPFTGFLSSHEELIGGEPVALTDATGKTHEFHFRSRLFGTGVILEAFELLQEYPSGYQFQVIGDPEEDPFTLLGRLIEKMRRALSIQYITKGECGLQIANLETVRGLIQWDDAGDGRVPILVVDGREITWEEFGRMLMAFEGSQFRLEIRELSDEL